MHSDSWTGPRADRFNDDEHQLIADLRDVIRRLTEVEQTALALNAELEQDLDGARRLRDAITRHIPGVGDPPERYHDWPAQWGNDPPNPGEPGWDDFYEWALAHRSDIS